MPEGISRQEMAEQYGMSYAFLKSVPELWRIFNSAVKQDWAASRFRAAVENSRWFKKNAESQRQVQYLRQTDPATYAQRRRQLAAQIRDAAEQIGARINYKHINWVADRALAGAWNDAQIRDALSDYVRAVNGVYLGNTGDEVSKIRQAAWRNGIRLNWKTVQKHAESIAAGNYDADYVIGGLRRQAASLAPSYADQLNAGMDLFDVASPYMESMSNILELNPAELDLFDPTIRRAINSKDKDGKPSSMTIGEFEESLRRDQRWRYTKNARESLDSVARGVLQHFGFSAI